MKHIYLNLKRFDVPPEYGGVNRICPVSEWGSTIVRSTQEDLKKYDPDRVEFIQFFPEAHLFNAVSALCDNSPILIGCQGVYRENTSPNGNFGALTCSRPASAMKAVGCRAALIGHCEERNDLKGIMREADAEDSNAVNRILNREISCAVKTGLKVVYCIGETQEEQPYWQSVLKEQLDTGLDGIDRSNVTIAYEPVWSIGPGKTPADKDYITKAAAFIKEQTDGMDVVYGGGLKAGNAAMLSSIEQIDGGLIALTRFEGGMGFYPEEYLNIIRIYLGKSYITAEHGER